jgi:hypothetical protein
MLTSLYNLNKVDACIFISALYLLSDLVIARKIVWCPFLVCVFLNDFLSFQLVFGRSAVRPYIPLIMKFAVLRLYDLEFWGTGKLGLYGSDQRISLQRSNLDFSFCLLSSPIGETVDH